MFNHWMFRCRDVSLLISRSMDEELPLSTRIGIRLHIFVCYLCARYKKQTALIQKAFFKLGHPDDSENLITPLPDDAAQRIKQALREANPNVSN